MAFGQQSGPPATHRQVQHLLELVVAAGHTGFRDARGPLGLTQRQGGGKFTRDEADELIALLEAEAGADTEVPAAGADVAADRTDPVEPAPRDLAAVDAPSAALRAAVTRRNAEQARGLRNVPDEVLAAELQRRGWAVLQP